MIRQENTKIKDVFIVETLGSLTAHEATGYLPILYNPYQMFRSFLPLVQGNYKDLIGQNFANLFWNKSLYPSRT